MVLSLILYIHWLYIPSGLCKIDKYIQRNGMSSEHYCVAHRQKEYNLNCIKNEKWTSSKHLILIEKMNVRMHFLLFNFLNSKCNHRNMYLYFLLSVLTFIFDDAPSIKWNDGKHEKHFIREWRRNAMTHSMKIRTNQKRPRNQIPIEFFHLFRSNSYYLILIAFCIFQRFFATRLWHRYAPAAHFAADQF